MTPPEQGNGLIGATATDANGDKIGSVGRVYANDETGQPEWVTVKTGLLGTKESLAPLYNAQAGQGEVRLAVTKQQVKDAPNLDAADDHLDPPQIDTLNQYYAALLTPPGTGTGIGTDRASTGTGWDRASTGIKSFPGTEFGDTDTSGSSGGEGSDPGHAPTDGYAGTDTE